jgi:predicted phosphodiesterase
VRALRRYGDRGARGLTKAAGSRRTLAAAALVAVTLGGMGAGMALGARTVTDVGPFHAELRITPSLSGTTTVMVPPLGSLHFDSHDGPAQLTVSLGALDQASVQSIINNPAGIAQAGRNAADDVVNGIIRVGFAGLGSAVLGSMALAALVYRNTRRVAWAGGLALAIVGTALGIGAATVRFSAVEEPRYEGLLANAPALVGDVQRIADDWERYSQQLQDMVVNVSLLYTTVSTLPIFEPDEDMTRVMHVSDLHLNPNAWTVMQTVVEQYGVDFIIDTGDIVDWGTGQESTYLEGVRRMEVPYVFVRGNHDSESTTQAGLAELPNSVTLDDDVTTIEGLTIAGIGDPRFTPDQRTDPFADDPEVLAQRVVDAGAQLADTVNLRLEPVHLAAVHDPRAAAPLDGLVDYVLAGHTHERRVGPVIEPAEGEEAAQPAPPGTLLMVQGSTGGAGLRGLQGEYPEPLLMSVLYFDEEQRLVAYDDITVGGHGLSEVSLQRHIVERPAGETAAAPQEGGTPPLPGGTPLPDGTPLPGGTPPPGGTSPPVGTSPPDGGASPTGTP